MQEAPAGTAICETAREATSPYCRGLAAYIITYTILGVPYYNYNYNGPEARQTLPEACQSTCSTAAASLTNAA